MSRDLILSHIDSFLKGTVVFLTSKLVQKQLGETSIAGWHNFFEDRIGTTGSAVPLMFLHNLNIKFFAIPDIIQGLLSAQSRDGSWSILSLNNINTIEGTAWPLKALALVADSKVRSNVLDAEAWILSQQHESGGWGSTIDNAPRTFLTAISIESLASMTPPSMEAIFNAVNWLRNTQRNGGSWGEVPGQDGTVFHTSLVIKTLVSIGIPASDQLIVDGLSFLKNEWSPDKSNFQSEIYYIKYEGGQLRTTVEHDVDSTAIEALLLSRASWAVEKVTRAVSEITEAYITENALFPPNKKPSIWNLIPRANALLSFLDKVPLSNSGKLINLKEAILYSPNEYYLTRRGLAFILLRRILIPRFPITAILLLVIIAITGFIFYQFYLGNIDVLGIVVSLGAEIVGLCLALLIENRNKK